VFHAFCAIPIVVHVGCAPHFALGGSSMICFQEEQLILEHFWVETQVCR